VTPEPHCDPHVGQPTVAASGPGNTGTLRSCTFPAYSCAGATVVQIMSVYESIKNGTEAKTWIVTRSGIAFYFSRLMGDADALGTNQPRRVPVYGPPCAGECVNSES
jgi:hypothetical protein